MYWLPDLTFLDIETTGGSHVNDRIIEIALIKIENGSLSLRWETLINPSILIPKRISELTGISNEMVRDAPNFEGIAGELFSHLSGSVMVAHNVRFDYGFLKAEYKRMGGTLRQRTLCTVKLSRMLYPTAQSHSLDALMVRFGLSTQARHRGMGDAQLMLDFLEAAKHDLGSVKVLEAIKMQLKGPTLPAYIDDSFLENIEDVPGVYLFFDDTGLPLYIGKSIKLKTRVLNHFASDHITQIEMEMAQRVRRIEWQETAGELGALLLEMKLIKALQPTYNKLLRKQTKFYALHLSESLNCLPWIKIVPIARVDPCNLGLLYGVFKTRKASLELIRKLANDFKLCHKLIGLEKGHGICFSRQLDKCSGVCVGQEKHEMHHLRLKTALLKYKLKAWPYKGKVGISELNHRTNKTQIHIFEHWCHLETLDDELNWLTSVNPRYDLYFDLDMYKLIKKTLLTSIVIELNVNGEDDPFKLSAY